MPTLIVNDKDKIPKEALLLGNLEITIKDCNGNDVTVHGLTANDLTVKTLQGEDIPLIQFIQNYAGTNVTNATVTMSDGSTTTVAQMADAVNEVEFTITQLEQKYNNS